LINSLTDRLWTYCVYALSKKQSVNRVFSRFLSSILAKTNESNKGRCTSLL